MEKELSPKAFGEVGIFVFFLRTRSGHFDGSVGRKEEWAERTLKSVS